MSKKIHKRKFGPDHRDAGQTDLEYNHTTECGYTRKFVTLDNEKVTCRFCLGVIKKELLK